MRISIYTSLLAIWNCDCCRKEYYVRVVQSCKYALHRLKLADSGIAREAIMLVQPNESNGQS